MRLKRLELIKYGKFDGTVLDFPQTAADFHVIVGPNEAGKSTVRNAISELLFGMPQRTKLDFRHPLPELRLGGVLESEAGETAFHRARGRTQLRTPTDESLPDSFLAPLLGTTDKAFFEQMFGLDHTQLVKGGQSILDGSKDVGQVLFQSAAGIASLGPVREALQEQVASLWTPRSRSTTFAQAVQRFDEANAELKSAQVKTKVWTEARNALDDVIKALEQEEAKRTALEATRSRLERVRRLAPFLLKLRDKSAELAALGEVIDFPPTAHAELIAGEADAAAAQVQLDTRTGDVTRRQAERDAISYDGAVLALRADIEALEVTRNQCRNHRRDLLLRQSEVDRLLDEVKTACHELGWPEEEPLLRASLPTPLALKTVTKLLRDRGALHQTMRNSADAVQQKQRDIDRLATELAAMSATEVPAELRQALSEAQTYKTSAAKQRTLTATVEQAEQRLQHATAALTPWPGSIEQLRSMTLPSTERITTLKRQRQELLNAVHVASDRLEEAKQKATELELAIKHFTQSHKVVTPAEVFDARSSRDATWQGLKNGAVPLASGAPVLDAAIRLADELVDAQLGSATDAASLQSTRQQLEVALAGVARLEATLATRTQELTAHQDQWEKVASDCSLSGLLLDDITAWLIKRDAVLIAADTHDEKQRELATEVAGTDAARRALQRALQASSTEYSSQDPEHDELPALCIAAEVFISHADAARHRMQTLQQQHDQGRGSLEGLHTVAATAAEDYRQWEAQWTAAIRQAKLEGASASLVQAEAAVELANKVTEALEKADAIRRERIATMQADLDAFAAETRRLAEAVTATGTAIPDNAGNEETAALLAERCRHAVAAAQKAELAEAALRTAQQQCDEAEARVRSAQARLKPLLELAGVTSAAEAFPLIDRSDTKRRLQAEMEEARNMLISDGDGLTVDAIAAEVALYDPTDIPALLDDAKRELAEVNTRLQSLSQDKVRADQAYSAIAGQADAAIAEAKRQEALAAMSDASEQYIEVATASKLLKWAIDRYRDRKQGPMLQRASTVFAALTLGDFSKLGVDYDKETPALFAMRKNGQIVEVTGLSEGTRDQLYLALRIAALELHLEQSTPLPFVADDLFINFDDERSKAGLGALRELSARTQVIFLTHHEHLVPLVESVFGTEVNVVELKRGMAEV